jgi:hypothetical protein
MWYVCMYVCVLMYVCCVYLCMYACMHVCTSVCLSVCLPVCLSQHTHIADVKQIPCGQHLYFSFAYIVGLFRSCRRSLLRML